MHSGMRALICRRSKLPQENSQQNMHLHGVRAHRQCLWEGGMPGLGGRAGANPPSSEAIAFSLNVTKNVSPIITTNVQF